MTKPRCRLPALLGGATLLAAAETTPVYQMLSQDTNLEVKLQAFDRDERSARYQAFRSAYFKRFQRDPGYSSVLAYDAATVLFDAMQRRTEDETLKQALVRHAPFQGLQQQIAFDANGDTPRTVYFTQIRDGRYVLLD